MANRTNNSAANLGFEDKLWAAADKLRGHMDAAEYKHVVLGLIFLKYISDAFQERYEQLSLWTADPDNDYFIQDEKARYDVLEDRDEYLAENVFWVPQEARWTAPAGQRQAARHRQAHRRRHGRHREGQPQPQGRAAQGLRPARR